MKALDVFMAMLLIILSFEEKNRSFKAQFIQVTKHEQAGLDQYE